MTMICPACGNMIGYNSYFGAFYCPRCGGLFKQLKPMTNADRMRSMSDEELAEFLTHMNPTNCQDCAFSHGWSCQPNRDDYSDFEKCEEGRKRWLQQPAEENKNGV